MQVGFIGLGRMGSAMASNLLAAGHQVTVFNRSLDKARPLVERGAIVAADVAGACRGDALVTMLADDAALDSVMPGERGALAALTKGAPTSR